MKRLLSLLLALAMLLGLTACGGSSTSAVSGAADPDAKADSAATEAKQDTPADPGPQDDTPAPAEDSGEPKELRVGTLDSTDNFDPCSNSDCGLGLMLVYDTVLKLNYETMEVEPCIATEWNWVDDTTLELTIREGVTFSNGDPLTPEDVLYSLSRFVFENDQFDPGYNVIDFDASGVDGSKLTLKLKEVDADFLLELTNDRWASVVNEEYVKANPGSFWDAPCGTGPYTCVENVDGSHSTYQRREDYWGELPSASTITVQNYSELTTMMADFETGALDLALDVGETDYLTAVDGGYGDDVQGKTFKTWDLLALCLPQYMDMFQDAKLREAISLSIDTQAITNAVYGSMGQVADSILIDGCDYYEPIGVHEYNPEKAKQLLKEAGYENGLDMKVVIPSMPANDKCAEIIQAYFADVGINLTVESYDFATAIPILMSNGTDISIFGTGGGTYTAKMITTTIGETSTNGGARVEDREFNDYLNAAATTQDTKVRQENYTKAAQWAFDNYWTLPISYAEAGSIYHSNISNVTGLVARSVDLAAVVVS